MQQVEPFGYDRVGSCRKGWHCRRGYDFQYIEIGRITPDGSATAETVKGEQAPSRATWIVHSEDVITTLVRPIRRLTALIGQEQDGYVCSSGFAVLQATSVSVEVLLVYLRLRPIVELLNLYTTASMYPAISAADLMKIPVKRPSATAAQRVREHIIKSRELRQRSVDCLKDAKLRVQDFVYGSRG
jgi:hypothetical protein